MCGYWGVANFAIFEVGKIDIKKTKQNYNQFTDSRQLFFNYFCKKEEFIFEILKKNLQFCGLFYSSVKTCFGFNTP
ncbi:MAG: hypothetical protein RL757_2277 [Bacteroidota bacterium]|jgi:hypothetical protein